MTLAFERVGSPAAPVHPTEIGLRRPYSTKDDFHVDNSHRSRTSIERADTLANLARAPCHRQCPRRATRLERSPPSRLVGRVRREIARATGPIFIAAHSFGALAAVQAASDHAERIAGALLVAPADPESFGVAEFLPTKPLGFPVIVVASINDPWMPFDRARRWSDLWRADLINLGEAGHINAEAGFGPWPEGLALLERLRRAAEFRSAAERLAALSLSHSRPLQRHWLARRRHALGRGGPGYRSSRCHRSGSASARGGLDCACARRPLRLVQDSHSAMTEKCNHGGEQLTEEAVHKK